MRTEHIDVSKRLSATERVAGTAQISPLVLGVH